MKLEEFWTGNWWIDAGLIGFLNMCDEVLELESDAYGELKNRDLEPEEWKKLGWYVYLMWKIKKEIVKNILEIEAEDELNSKWNLYKIKNKTIKLNSSENNDIKKEISKIEYKVVKNFFKKLNKYILKKENVKIDDVIQTEDLYNVIEKFINIDITLLEELLEDSEKELKEFERILQKKLKRGEEIKFNQKSFESKKNDILKKINKGEFIASDGLLRNFILYNIKGVSKIIEIIKKYIEKKYTTKDKKDIHFILPLLKGQESKGGGGFNNINYKSLWTLENIIRDENLWSLLQIQILSPHYAFNKIREKNIFFYTLNLEVTYKINKKIREVEKSNKQKKDIIRLSINEILLKMKSEWVLKNMYFIEYEKIENQKIIGLKYFPIDKINATLILKTNLLENVKNSPYTSKLNKDHYDYNTPVIFFILEDEININAIIEKIKQVLNKKEKAYINYKVLNYYLLSMIIKNKTEEKNLNSLTLYNVKSSIDEILKEYKEEELRLVNMWRNIHNIFDKNINKEIESKLWNLVYSLHKKRDTFYNNLLHIALLLDKGKRKKFSEIILELLKKEEYLYPLREIMLTNNILEAIKG